MNPLTSLRGRLAIAVAAVSLVSVATAGIGIVWQLDRQDRAETDKDLRSRVAHILAGDKMSEQAQAAAFDGREDEYSMLLDGSGSAVRLIEYGEVIAERGDAAGELIAAPTAAGLSDVAVEGTVWRSYVVSADDETTLQVLQSLAPIDERLVRNVQIVAAVTLAVTLLAAILGWVVASQIMRPLSALRAAAQGIRSGHDAETLPRSTGPREIDELADTLNAMIRRLQDSTAVARRFTADAGHELRTPLTSMGTYIETLERNPEPSPQRRREMVTELASEHRRLVSLLAGLQQLARVDAAVLPASEEMDVVELIAGAVRRARIRHSGVAFELDQSTADIPLLEGWPDGIRVLIDNLLDNAALHGRPDGRVQIQTMVVGDRLVLRVADDGPGIPESDRERVWDRFARGEDARGPGSGLGLSLVGHQVTLHGGTAVLGESRWGGLQVDIELPLTGGRRAASGNPRD